MPTMSLRPLTSARKRVRSWNWHRLIVSFWSCLAFVGLGSSLLVFGPTLLDLADHLNVGVAILAIMFTCRAVGGVIGSVASGVILDKYTTWSYTILSVVIFSCMITTVILPLSIHAAMLGAFMFLNGVSSGGLDNGVHAVLVPLWGEGSGPCMQILHFSWAFGAFIAPLVAKQFIQEVSEECRNLTSGNIDELNCTSYPDWNVSASSNTSYSEAPSQFSYAYYVTASLFIPSLVAFLYFAVRHECVGRCCFQQKESREEDKPHPRESTNKESPSNKYPLCYLVILFTLIFCFMFLYVGLEAGFGSLIFTVAVTGELDFSKTNAALLQSVYWGAFAFTRLLSVTLAILQVRASIMIMGNLFGSFVATLIMTFYTHNSTAIWIGSAVLGMSFASIFPTVMTWMSENAKASGKATAVLVTGGTLGDITLPAIMGALVAQVHPDSLIYITFVGVILSAGIAALIFLTACLQKRNREHGLQTWYNRLKQEIALEEVTGDSGINNSFSSNHIESRESEDIGCGEVDAGSQNTIL